MNDCGHASGITYAGCMKCDLDKLKEHIAELQATIERVRGLKRHTIGMPTRVVEVVDAGDLDEALGDKV